MAVLRGGGGREGETTKALNREQITMDQSPELEFTQEKKSNNHPDRAPVRGHQHSGASSGQAPSGNCSGGGRAVARSCSGALFPAGPALLAVFVTRRYSPTARLPSAPPLPARRGPKGAVLDRRRLRAARGCPGERAGTAPAPNRERSKATDAKAPMCV